MSLGGFVSPFGVDATTVLGRVSDDEAWRLVLEPIILATRSGDNSPVVVWISRSATLTIEPPAVPPRVTLAFAPGAVLTLGPSVTLEVFGRLDVGVERHFELAVDARVLLRGPLDEIHASWWGTGPEAITHALDALWDRYSTGLDPAPIQLSGPYLLRDPVHVTPPASVTSGHPERTFEVALRGRHYGLGSPATFQVDDLVSVGGMDALLAVDGPVTVTLEHLGFDVTRRSGLSPARSALLLAGDHDRSIIADCSFRLGGALRVDPTGSRDRDAVRGIDITALGLAWRNTLTEFGRGLAIGVGFGALLLYSAGLVGLARAASRVSVARCRFEGTGPGDAQHVIPLSVDVTAPTMLDVSDSQFQGRYGQGIAFVGSELMVTHCAFDNTVTPINSDPLRGVDILLGPRDPLPEVVRSRGVNAHLTVTHCVSSSPTFLAARPAFIAEDPGGAVLTSVLHQPPPSPKGDGTSIRWMGSYEPRSLVLQGCEFGAPVRLMDITPPGVVVMLGTRFVGLEGTRQEVVGGPEESVVGLYSPPG